MFKHQLAILKAAETVEVLVTENKKITISQFGNCDNEQEVTDVIELDVKEMSKFIDVLQMAWKMASLK